MPDFEITAPDGRKFIVTAPEGASPDQVLSYAQSQFGQKAPEAPAEPQPNLMQQGLRGLGLGVRSAVNVAGSLPGLAYDVLRAPGQAITAGINAATGANIPAGYSSRDILTGASDLAGLPKPETEGERMNSAIAEALGGVASGYGAGVGLARSAAPMAQAAGRMLTTQPLTQAASAATGAAVSEYTDSPALGIAASLATPLAIAGARRAVSPVPNVNSPGRQALVEGAERRGIPLTAGQATGSRFLQNVESQFEQLPFTSGPQRAIREDQNRALIRDAWRYAGETADDTMPATINAARSRIGGTIGEIANRNTLRFTPQLDAELQQITDSLRFIPPEAAGPVRARIDQLRGMASPSAAPNVPPTIPGASYRMLDSELGRTIRSTNNGDLKAALSDLRGKLRTAMDASISPADAADWQQARREYANLMVIADAAGRAGSGAAEGMMSPAALRQAVDTSTGRGYKYGQGDLNELARIGQALIKPPSDSGTAGRSYANNLLTGSLGVGGATAGGTVGGVPGAMLGGAATLALPRIAQMLMNSETGQRYLRNQVAANPTLTRDLAKALLVHQLSGSLPDMRTQ